MRTPTVTPTTQAPPSPATRASSEPPANSAAGISPTAERYASPTPLASAAAEATCPLSSEPKSPAPTTALISPAWYEGADGYERAQRDHAPHHIPTFVYLFTDWCPHCRRFERELLTAPAVEHFMRDQVVKVRVNPEAGVDDRSFADRLGVDGYPSLRLICEGQAPRSISTHLKHDKEATLRSPEEFVAGIDEALTRCVDNELRQARTQWQQGNAAGTIARLDDILALRPRMASAYVERALAHANANATEAALDDLRRAAGIDADGVAVFDTLESVLSRQQRWDEVAACWTHLLRRFPTNAHALLQRGGALYRKGDRERALADAREACRLGEARACELASQSGR